MTYKLKYMTQVNKLTINADRLCFSDYTIMVQVPLIQERLYALVFLHLTWVWIHDLWTMNYDVFALTFQHTMLESKSFLMQVSGGLGYMFTATQVKPHS